jgi:hypothetical protein
MWRRRSSAPSCKTKSSHIFPAGATQRLIKYSEKQRKIKNNGKQGKTLTNESLGLGLQAIYDGILTRDLLRNLVAQGILGIVEPLAEISNRNGIFFGFFAGLFDEL